MGRPSRVRRARSEESRAAGIGLRGNRGLGDVAWTLRDDADVGIVAVVERVRAGEREALLHRERRVEELIAVGRDTGAARLVPGAARRYALVTHECAAELLGAREILRAALADEIDVVLEC